MKKYKLILLTFLLALSTNALFAHALWIETPAAGKVQQKQTVKIYYGEYAENERDSVAKWYSDVKDLTLWLVGPDQKKIQLTLTPGLNHLESTFTPTENGIYILQVSHEAKELGGDTKYHFLSSTNVTVGKVAQNTVKSTNVLQLKHDLTAKVNTKIKLAASLNDTAAKDRTVSVFSPMGWTREIKTDENGYAEFTPLWPGTYVVEISDIDKTPGQHYGKDFTSTWKGATYSFEVTK